MKAIFSQSVIATVFLILFSTRPAFPQIEIFDDLNRFSDEAPQLEPRFVYGISINEAVSALGVSFRGVTNTRAVRHQIVIALHQIPIIEESFRQEGADGAAPAGRSFTAFSEQCWVCPFGSENE